jgi:hypothetical protein
MYAIKKVLLAGAALGIVAVLGLTAIPSSITPSAAAKGGGGHGGAPAPTTPILSNFGPVGTLTPQAVYTYMQTADPNLAATAVQIQTNAPTDLHFLADVTVTNGAATCNELSAFVYADPANANVRIFAQGHTGAIWSFRDGVTGSCN